MAEPAEDQSIGDPSKENPETSIQKPINSFSFQIHPASILKHAIRALSDAHFNPRGVGVIEVGANGVEIRSLNTKTRVICYLNLNACGLINFHYNKPFTETVDLNRICSNLDVSNDEDTIEIQHADGSNEIKFKFGELSTSKFAVESVEMNEDFRKAPVIIHKYEVAIGSEDLREIIQHVEASTFKFVSFDIAHDIVSIKVGKKEWNYDCFYAENVPIRELESWQKHHAWFRWLHCESLKKASFLAEEILLCLVTYPPHCMILQFNLRELGDLVYIKGANLSHNPGVEENSDTSEQKTETSKGHAAIMKSPKEKSTASFSFQIHPASNLTYALDALCYLGFMLHNSGFIKVSREGLEIITGLNTETKVLGRLYLLPAGLINFNYRQQISTLIDFARLFFQVIVANDDDEIKIHHVGGSSEIQFMFGRVLPRRIGVKLHDALPAGFRKLPWDVAKFEFTTMIASQELRQIIQHVEASTSKIVSFDISEGTLSINVEGKEWIYWHDNMDVNHVTFEMLLPQLPHCESLKKASFLTENVLWSHFTNPSKCIMLTFLIHEHGYLEYVMGRNLFFPKFSLGKQSGTCSEQSKFEPGERESSSGTDQYNTEPALDKPLKANLRPSNDKPPLSKQNPETSIDTSMAQLPESLSMDEPLKDTSMDESSKENAKPLEEDLEPSKHPPMTKPSKEKPTYSSDNDEQPNCEPGEQEQSSGTNQYNTNPAMDKTLKENQEPSNQNPLPLKQTPETATDPSISDSSKEKCAEPSKEIPEPQTHSTDSLPLPLVAEPSEDTTETNTNYIKDPLGLKGCHLDALSKTKLKDAIEALRDVHFNEHGKGIIEVGPKGLEIAAVNTRTKCVGYIHLKATRLVDFNYKKIVDLNQISQHLSSASEDDAVAIHHVHGSNELSLMFGELPNRRLPVELLQINGDFKVIPSITCEFEVTVSSQLLRQIIEHVEASTTKNGVYSHSQKGEKKAFMLLLVNLTFLTISFLFSFSVTFDIREYIVNVQVGNKKWKLKHAKKDFKKNLEKKLLVHFKWLHCQSLKKASLVARKAFLGLVTDSSKWMLRFLIRGQGELVYIMGPDLILHEIAPGEKGPSSFNEVPNLGPGKQSSCSGTGLPSMGAGDQSKSGAEDCLKSNSGESRHDISSCSNDHSPDDVEKDIDKSLGSSRDLLAEIEYLEVLLTESKEKEFQLQKELVESNSNQSRLLELEREVEEKKTEVQGLLEVVELRRKNEELHLQNTTLACKVSLLESQLADLLLKRQQFLTNQTFEMEVVHPHTLESAQRGTHMFLGSSRDFLAEIENLKGLLTESKEKEFQLQAKLVESSRNQSRILELEREVVAKKNEVQGLLKRVKALEESEKTNLNKKIFFSSNSESVAKSHEPQNQTLDKEVVKLKSKNEELRLQNTILVRKISFLESQLAYLLDKRWQPLTTQIHTELNSVANSASVPTSNKPHVTILPTIEMEMVELRRMNKELQLKHQDLACRVSALESQLANLTNASHQQCPKPNVNNSTVHSKRAAPDGERKEAASDADQ